MPGYTTPVPEFRFLLQEVFDFESQVTALPGLEDASMDVVLAVLEAAGEFARDSLVPINSAGDAAGCVLEPGAVRTPGGYQDAYQKFCDGGWPALAGDPAYGGQGLPLSLALFVRELIASGSMAFGMYGGLSQGAYRAISAHGTPELKALCLPRLIDGSWTGTMCLTEPEAGSDLSRLRTRALPAAQGIFNVTGAKIFISGGDHDLARNIVHLVLARLPDAPAGTKGISLFIVPKFWPMSDGGLEPNGVTCTAIEHKMGIQASATAALSFENARGWLLGEPHSGLRAMFTMMNSSRLGVAVQSVGVAELSFQNARHYAMDRRQGRAPRAGKPALAGAEQDPIVMHPDVHKLLLTMKALVEGCRALYAESAIWLDVRARHANPAARAEADAALALMTSVLKSFISDSAVEATRLGMAVFGGHGYIHDNGMEQLMRDACIVPLYEGTNGIQALDLVHRKITADGGAAMDAFAARVRDTLASVRTGGALPTVCAQLEQSLAHLADATRLMQDRAATDAMAAAAGASDYLRLVGLVACGHAWLRMASIAHGAAGAESAAFYEGKIRTARFFMTHLLPDTARLAHAIQSGSATVTDIRPEQL